MNNIKNKVSCKAKAVDLLARSDQSRKRLIEKLKRSKYSEEEIEETVAWLEEKRYLREEDCCERRFQYMYEDSSYSLRQICVKLMQQGFAMHHVNMSYLLAKICKKPVEDVIILKTPHNTWNDVAKKLGISEAECQQIKDKISKDFGRHD